MGCTGARAGRRDKISAGAGDREVLWEGRAGPQGWGREAASARQGSAQPEEEFDLYSEGNGRL